jgi:hypothetical protein
MWVYILTLLMFWKATPDNERGDQEKPFRTATSSRGPQDHL